MELINIIINLKNIHQKWNLLPKINKQQINKLLVLIIAVW